MKNQDVQCCQNFFTMAGTNGGKIQCGGEVTNFDGTKQIMFCQFCEMLNKPSEKWKAKGFNLSAFSSNSDGLINSFIAKTSKGKIYGVRKHEFLNGKFTGKQWFEIKPA